MRRLLPFLPLLLVIGFSLLLWQGLGHDPNNQDDAILGRPLPDASAKNLLNPAQTISLHSLKGRPFILNIWASWCPNCRAEHPLLMQLAQTVPLYGINYRDKPEAARDWLVRSGNPFLFVLDDRQGKLAIELGVYGTPETLLFSGDGILLSRHTGLLTEKVWAESFAPHLEAASASREGER